MNGFKRACVVAFLGALAMAPAAAADPGQVGSWSAVQNYPVVPVSMGITPDGKIVAWDQANAAPYFGPVPHNGPAMVLDPTTGTITRSINVAPSTMFCSLITSLPDGRLAIIGGGSGSNAASSKVQIYDGDSQTFSVAGEMERTRWYPGGDIDARGNVLVAGGTSTGIEKVDANTGTGTLVNTTFPTNWYPDLIRMPDGRFTIEDVGDNVAGSGAGPGRYLLSGNSLTTIGDNTLLQKRQRGIRTEISPYRFFYNGGGTSTDSMIIDVSSGTPQYTSAAPSLYPHMTGEAITLPTGEVLAIGGNSSGNDTAGTPVLTPELYSPSANAWTTMATMDRQRQYHSVAALLPDGRVWSAGTSYNANQEQNGQFYSPPYLFKHDGSGQLATRPTATGAPSVVKWGETFSVATDNPANIASASLIRLAATTHQLNAGQAAIPLSVTPNGGRVQMTVPGGNAAPAGYYMVFLVDRNGVPSVAPILRVKPDDETAIAARVTQSSQVSRDWGASEAFDGNASNTAGAAGSVSQTNVESQPWWQVDLGASRDLESVTLQFRTDAGTQARDVWVFASDSPFGSVTVDGLRAQSGVAAVHLQTPAGDVATATLQRTARYIRVQAPGTSTSLSLAEVTPNARIVPPPLTTPSLTATATSNTQINLSWADQANETGYTLQRDTSSAFGSPTAVDLPANSTSYSSTGLNASTTYYYRLRANGASSTTSNWSTTASATTQAAPPPPLTTPTLAATATSSTQINLSWADQANETGYTLQRDTSSAFASPTAVDLAANATSYSSTGLNASTTYYYRLRANGASSTTSNWSTTASASTQAAPPPPLSTPTLAATASSSTQINLSWADQANETGYTLQRDTSSAFGSPTTVELNANATSSSATGLNASTTYYYRLRAKGASSTTSNWSTTASATTQAAPPLPLTTPSLSATATSTAQINLSWADQANETGYTLQRDTSSAFGSPTTVELSANATSSSATGLSPSTTYYFRLRANGASSTTSNWSTTASATTLTGGPPVVTPNAPSGLRATTQSSSRINLRWTDNANNESGYTLQRSRSASFSSPTTVELPANATTYSSTGLSSSTTYYYRVRAKTSSATSAWSAMASARTQRGWRWFKRLTF
jgi:phosphodiesterase/alkaline phosphatase D-like protein